jgi:hypothetical protein
MLENVLKHHYPDQEYIIPIEILRGCLDDANAYYADYRYPAHEVNDHEQFVMMVYRRNIEKHQDQVASQLLVESPEYQERQEKERIRQEKLETERLEKLAVWTKNSRLQRIHNMSIPDQGHINVAKLCHEAEDYHWEFYEQFFSPEYCGWDVPYDGQWQGWQFPPEAGPISENFFSATGSIFISDGVTKGEPVPKWNFIMTYGFHVCGYKLNSLGRFEPSEYHHTKQGFTEWLKKEQRKRDGTFIEHGTVTYWENLFGGVMKAVFADQLESDQPTITDAPRHLHHLVVAYWGADVCASYTELENEKNFKEIMLGCLPGGEHHERSQRYFKTENAGRKGCNNLKLTLNLATLDTPLTPEADEALVDHVYGLAMNSPLAGKEYKEPLKDKLDRWALEAKQRYDDGYIWDDNARAEAEQESQD